jgi:hypothetical protein
MSTEEKKPDVRRAPPNEAEQRWIAANLRRALLLGRDHGDPATSTEPSLSALDRAWVAGCAELRETNGDPNPLIQALGIALGQRLVDTHDLSWVVATDALGTEMAVYGEVGEVLVYPLNLVAKRWQRTEGAFLAALTAAMDADLKALRARR